MILIFGGQVETSESCLPDSRADICVRSLRTGMFAVLYPQGRLGGEPLSAILFCSYLSVTY